MKIRGAGEKDLAAIQAIYAHHVLNGIASFEETPPDIEEMARRMTALKKSGYPFRVVEMDGAVRGYSYGGCYRSRPAYRHTVENSIYVDAGSVRLGLGGALLEDLIEQCVKLGFRQMIAVIGDSGNAASIRLHARHGFRHCGVLRSLGFKHGRWIDQVMMQLSLGEGDANPP